MRKKNVIPKRKINTNSIRKLSNDLQKQSEKDKERLSSYVSEKTEERIVKYSAIGGIVFMLFIISPLLMKIGEWNVNSFKKLKQAVKS